MIELEIWELGLAALLVMALAGCLVAARMVVQLSLVGLVLEVLFRSANAWAVATMSLVMLLVAGREVTARQKRRLRGAWGFGIGTGAMFASSFAVTVFGLAAIVRADPWWEPRYAIPILGMMLGNTMTGVALCVDRLTAAAWDGREVIEARLALGEPARVAVGDMARDALRAGLTPVINAMAVAGVVSLPGMMTGQILAGNAPGDAVRYQIMIWLLIAAGCGFGMLIAVRLTVRRLFDERDRLRLDRLRG